MSWVLALEQRECNGSGARTENFSLYFEKLKKYLVNRIHSTLCIEYPSLLLLLPSSSYLFSLSTSKEIPKLKMKNVNEKGWMIKSLKLNFTFSVFWFPSRHVLKIFFRILFLLFFFVFTPFATGTCVTFSHLP